MHIANAILDIELVDELPAVAGIDFNIIETEKTDWVGRLLTESLKVSHQCIGKGVPGGVGISISAEIDCAVRRVRTRIVVFSITRIHRAKFEGVLPLLPSEVIGRRDVGRWRQEREIRSRELCRRSRRERTPNSGEGHVRNAIGKSAGIGERKWNVESVGGVFPVGAGRGNPLFVPGRC